MTKLAIPPLFETTHGFRW